MLNVNERAIFEILSVCLHPDLSVFHHFPFTTTKMKNQLTPLLCSVVLLLALLATSEKINAQGFPSTASNWDIPFLDYYASRAYGEYGEHQIIDITGDGKADLVDLEDDGVDGMTWLNGTQQYWKVYVGDGNGFSTTASSWNIPFLDYYASRFNGQYGEHALIDMNGDAKPDLVDLQDDNNAGLTWMNGSQQYWKVYINSGSSFAANAEHWNIPFLDYYADRAYGEYGEHTLVDMNGDGKPDLIDLEDDNNSDYTWLNGSQQYWKVFINTGSGFSSTASDWNIPYLDAYATRAYGEYGEHYLIDMNGDQKTDLVDLEDDGNNDYTWLNGSQQFWKVYINSGTSFSTSAENWNIPYLDAYAQRAYGEYGEHTLIDMNGDDKPELVDLKDDANTGYTWLNGSQQYWKVFINSGNGFATNAENWNIPYLDAYATRAFGEYGEHTLIDMNGDSKTDLVDLEDDANDGLTWLDGSQQYWKVFLQSTTVGDSGKPDNVALYVYPNPFTNHLVVNGTSANGELILVDVLGREILRQKASSTTTVLDTRKLHQAVFVIAYVEGQITKKYSVVKY